MRSGLLDSFWQWVFDVSVHSVATFVAAVMNHPAVERACAKVMARGMTEFFIEAPETAKLDQARNAGEDFPKLVGSFFQGMFLPRKGKPGSSSSGEPGHSPHPAPATSRSNTPTVVMGVDSTSSSRDEEDTKSSEPIIERFEIHVPTKMGLPFPPLRQRTNSAATK